MQQDDTVTGPRHYQQPVQHNFFFALAAWLSHLLQPAPGAPPGLEGSQRRDLPLVQVGVAAGLTSLPQLSDGVPQGYLRLLAFNRDSVLVAQQLRHLTAAARNNYQPLQAQLFVPQDGYVTAYVGNGSDVDVLFDDVRVEHWPGVQVQEVQYDPAGLELAGLAPPSPGIKGLNNYRFNGKELQADLGLAWNHQDWRFFDPRLLRWHSVDPEIENGQESWTPYSFGYDNAVRYADANGRCPLCPLPIIKQAMVRVYNSVVGRLATTLGASSSEQTYVKKHPFDALRLEPFAGDAARTAEVANLEPTTQRGEGSKTNGMRHALGQAMVANSVSPQAAKQVADAHEGGTANALQELKQNAAQLQKEGQTTLPRGLRDGLAGSFVDQLNNATGRTIGEQNPKATNNELANVVLDVMGGKSPTLHVYGSRVDSNGNTVVYPISLSGTAVREAKQNLQPSGRAVLSVLP